MRDSVRNALGRLRNPAQLVSRVVDRLVPGEPGPATPPPSRPEHLVDCDLATALAELDRQQVRRVLVHGDADLRDQVAGARAAWDLTWTSHAQQDLAQGAGRLDAQDLAASDAVLVGGPDLVVGYRFALRLLEQRELDRPVVWVGEGFEMCGGTLPVPTQADEATLYLFQHFEDFFQVKDPLLIRLDVVCGSVRKRSYRVLAPRTTLRLRLSDELPERDGPAAVIVHTTHPVLTRGRHTRWRFTADLSWQGSPTTLHGAHDFRGPEASNTFRLAEDLIERGSLVVTLPNYADDLTSSLQVTCTSSSERLEHRRVPGQLVEQVEFSRAEGAVGHFGCEYQGYGASFFYYLDEEARSLASNHQVSGLVSPAEPTPLDEDERGQLEELERAGLLLTPLPLPVVAGGELELGFTVRASNPPLRHAEALLFAKGQVVARLPLDLEALPPRVWAGDLLARAGRSDQDVDLIVIRPDWLREGRSPRQKGLLADLLVRCKGGQDWDLTEWQSCWRNLGVEVPGFPHWLRAGVVGRANLLGRALVEEGKRSGLLVVNASGAQAYSTTARVSYLLLDPSGRERVAERPCPPFATQLLWLDELFEDPGQHLPDGYGTVLIRSRDADLNVQLVTTEGQGRVALQHLWGY
jgi:hypothetical protein